MNPLSGCGPAEPAVPAASAFGAVLTNARPTVSYTHLVADGHVIPGHIAAGRPADLRVAVDILHVAIRIAHRLDADGRRFHRADLRRGLGKAQRRGLAILHRAVGRYGGDRHFIGHAVAKIGQRYGKALVCHRIVEELSLIHI